MENPFIIAIISGILAIAASLVATSIKNKGELRKIRKELEQKYATGLFQLRLEKYPELYAYLSTYSKHLQYGTNTRENLLVFRNQVDQWNSKNAFLFTKQTSRISYRFRNFLQELLDGSPEALDAPHHWNTINKAIDAFEASLRAEIGIFDTQPAGVVKNLEQAYQLLDQAVEDVQSLDEKAVELPIIKRQKS